MNEPAQTAGPGDGPALPGRLTAAGRETGRMPRGSPGHLPPGGVPGGRFALGDLLGTVSGELAARGLAVTEFHYDGELVEADVANPSNPDQGKANIGRDGYLIWERWGPSDGSASAEATVNIVTGLLAGKPVEQRDVMADE
jgi:hypothetical protein